MPAGWWAAVFCVGALLAAVAMGYDPALVGKYYVPRFALLYPLTLSVVVLTLLQRRRKGVSPGIDVLDVLALAFGCWQALSAALSPSPVIAWLGYYNRGTGALFWIALSVLFVATRRLLDHPRGRQALTWFASLVLVAAGLIAMAQVAGASTLWGGAVINGRVAGPTGNPIALAGLSLLGVWLAAGLPSWPRRSATLLMALAGVVGGATCLVLTVSRAAYLGVAVGVTVLAVAWIVERRRRALIVLASVCAAGLVATLGYGLASGADANLLSRLSGARIGGLTRSDSLRVALWREGVAGAAWRPLSGAGSGAFVIADRLYRSPEDRIRQPWVLASDPHSLPILVASTSGAPGLLLALAFAALFVWTTWPRRRPLEDGDGSVRPRAPELRVAGLSYLAATTVFVLVSPLDLAVAVPVVVVAAVTCGAPPPERRLSWSLPERIWRSWATALTVLTAVPVCAALAAAVVWGGSGTEPIGRLRSPCAWARQPASRKRRRCGAGSRSTLLKPARRRGGRASPRRTPPQSPAGARWCSRVSQGVAPDATGALGYADLARLDIAQGRPAQAVVELRTGLRWNPHHPALRGLWGYAALSAQTQVKDEALASELMAGLQSLPADSPDAWFWISRVLAARGDAAGAAAARARAKELAPALGSRRYGRRLLQGR